MRKFLRYVRTTLSSFCGLACVLLIVLWVRSYWRSDSVEAPVVWPHGCSVESLSGRLVFATGSEQDPYSEWAYDSYTMDDAYGPGPTLQFYGPVFDVIVTDDDGIAVHLPHWFLALVCGAISFVLARRRRYGVRTLLIVVTLIAIGLGAIAYYATHAKGGKMPSGFNGLASAVSLDSGPTACLTA